MSHRILVIEDDRDIANLLQLHLRDLGMGVDVANDGLDGWEKLQAAAYALVVLDIALPSLDGLEICRRVRARAQYTTILMLTSKDTELDRVLGLELGADDYLTKPFSIREFLARVKALFRRGEALDGAIRWWARGHPPRQPPRAPGRGLFAMARLRSTLTSAKPRWMATSSL